jgi:hypothetical protein
MPPCCPVMRTTGFSEARTNTGVTVARQPMDAIGDPSSRALANARSI